jgi:BioD-like phosphotransacetylase family protein
MQTILVASTRRYSGKTGVCMALIEAIETRGLRVGYFKPYGGMPRLIDGRMTDRDAAFINRHLADPAPDDVVCPIVRTRGFVEALLAGEPVPGPDEVVAAFARASRLRDVMVVESPSDLEQGAAAGVSAPDLLRLIGGRVLLVESSEAHDPPDRIVAAAARLGGALAGVIHNRVTEADHTIIAERFVTFLAARGIRSFGVLPLDPLLSSVTVREIVDALGGSVLCAGDRLDTPVESFMVGAMGQEKALRFFRRRAHKAVVTGGDRADVQMAALETSTAALVLTGNMTPSPAVVARADELGVCTIVVDTDTLTAVERLDTLFGHVRLHGPGKADRMRRMFAEGVALDDLLAAFDVSTPHPDHRPEETS